jgi:hypothetical protein
LLHQLIDLTTGDELTSTIGIVMDHAFMDPICNRTRDLSACGPIQINQGPRAMQAIQRGKQVSNPANFGFRKIMHKE